MHRTSELQRSVQVRQLRCEVTASVRLDERCQRVVHWLKPLLLHQHRILCLPLLTVFWKFYFLHFQPLSSQPTIPLAPHPVTNPQNVSQYLYQLSSSTIYPVIHSVSDSRRKSCRSVLLETTHIAATSLGLLASSIAAQNTPGLFPRDVPALFCPLRIKNEL